MEHTATTPFAFSTINAHAGPYATRHAMVDLPLSACAEPLPAPDEPGPLQLLIDEQALRLERAPDLLDWARATAQRAPLVLLLLRHLPERRAQGTHLIDLSYAYLLTGELARGVELSHHAAALMARLGDVPWYEEIYLRVARAYRRQPDLDQVLHYLDRAVTPPAPLVPQPRTVYVARHTMVEILLRRRDHAAAVPLLEQTLAAAPDPRSRRTAQLLLAMLLGEGDRHEEALALLRPLQAELQRDKGEFLLTQLRYALIHTLRALGRPGEAVQEQEALLRAARAQRAPRALLLEYLVHSAMLWTEAGDHQRALQRWTEALPLVDPHGDPGLAALVRNNVAVGTRLNGEPRRALRLAREAAEQAPPALRSILRISQAQAHMDLKEYQDAAHLFDEALAQARAQRGEALVDQLLLQRGDAQVMFDVPAARRSFAELLERSIGRHGTPQAPSPADEAGLRQRVGLSALLDGDRAEATAQLRAIAALAREQGDEAGAQAAGQAQVLLEQVVGTPEELRTRAALLQALQRPVAGAPPLRLAELLRQRAPLRS